MSQIQFFTESTLRSSISGARNAHIRDCEEAIGHFFAVYGPGIEFVVYLFILVCITWTCLQFSWQHLSVKSWSVLAVFETIVWQGFSLPAPPTQGSG